MIKLKLNSKFNTFTAICPPSYFDSREPLLSAIPQWAMDVPIEITGGYQYNAYGGVNVIYANTFVDSRSFAISPDVCDEIESLIEQQFENDSL